MYWATPEAMLTIVPLLWFTTVNAFAPIFLIKALWPLDTCVAGGILSFKLPVVADTSMMFATTLVVLPLIGHCSSVSTEMVIDS